MSEDDSNEDSLGGKHSLFDELSKESELIDDWTVYSRETDDNEKEWFVGRVFEDHGIFIDDMGEQIEFYDDADIDDLPSFETNQQAQVAYQGAVAPEEDETTPRHESNVVDTDSGEEPERKSVEVTESDDLKDDEDFDDENIEDEPESYFEEKVETTKEIIDEIKEGPEEEVIESSFKEEYEKAKEKIKKAKAGDKEAKEDVEDIPNRLKATFKRGAPGWEDFLDTLLAITIAFSGLILIGIVLTRPPTSEAYEILNSPTRYGDLFLLTTILLGVSMVGFWIGRRLQGTEELRENSRRILGLLQIIPISVVVIIALSFGLGQGRLFNTVQRWWDGFEATLASLAPEPLAAVGVWYLNNSAIISVRLASFVMLIFGISITIPFATRTTKRAIKAAATDKDDFWTFENERTSREEVLTLVEDEEETEEEDEEFKLGAFDRKEVDEQIKELIQLPEEMTQSPYKNYREVRRYWVRAPYSYISIVYNDKQNDYRYVTVEPELNENEEMIREEFDERLSSELLFENVEESYTVEEKKENKIEKLENKLISLAEEYDIDTRGLTFHRILYYIERDYIHYNKIDPMMEDPNVEDISCDGENTYVFVFHRDYKDLLSNVRFGREDLRSFITQVAQRSDEHISAANPMVDASLPDGSRAQLTLGSEITTRGSTFTIRLFKEIPFTPIDLLDYETFDVNQMSYLWLAIEQDKSLIFAGGTASGKTTSMNAVSLFIPPKAKIVTLEDTREISLPHENWIPGTTRDSVGAAGGEDITMYDLLRSALRQRPEYLIVGEIRGEEAQTLFQAMSTGHTTYSTMHADTAKAAIGRLTNPPINVPRQMVEALDIICIQQQVRLPDEEGNVRNVRRNVEIREIIELRDDESFRTHPAYTRDAERDEFVEQLDDSHILRKIQQEQGWDREQLVTELEQRRDVLNYLLDKEITDFELVSRTIQAYMIDKERIIEQVNNETLDPGELEDLTELKFKEQSKRLSQGQRQLMDGEPQGELPSSDEQEAASD